MPKLYGVPAILPAVQPSAGERWYLEDLARRQAVQAEQFLDERGTRAHQLILHAARRDGADVKYETITVTIGDVSAEYQQEPWKAPVTEVPGRFGTAYGFVCTVQVGAHRTGDTWLWWQLVTSVNGEHWAPLTPLDRPNSFFLSQADGVGTGRILGPFGDRLGIRFGAKSSTSLDGLWGYGVFANVLLTLGVQRS